MSKWIVELEDGCWLAPWAGDPGRTLDRDNARRFETERGAKIALGKARFYRPFKNAKVQDLGLLENAEFTLKPS